MDDSGAREFIIEMFKGYKARKENNNLFSSDDIIPQKIIEVYYNFVEKPAFSNLVNEYKKRYIYNESRVETNTSPEEQKGLGVIYDYLGDFDFKTDKFNIFVCSLLIHQKLYSKCPGSSFGGKLRDSQAVLNDLNIEVMSADEAKKYISSFINNSDFIFEPLETCDIFKYINQCIVIITNLIKAQPFADGNKRTFRALLNLMLKKISIPPIYIEVFEREEYSKALIKAMQEEDYSKIIRFYYYKICDSISELDVKKSVISGDMLSCEQIQEKLIQ